MSDFTDRELLDGSEELLGGLRSVLDRAGPMKRAVFDAHIADVHSMLDTLDRRLARRRDGSLGIIVHRPRQRVAWPPVGR